MVEATRCVTSGGETSELEKLEKAVVTTRKRLETATGKLEATQAEGSDLVEALQTGVDKTRAKLEAAEKALHEYQKANSEETTETAAPVDAAQAAIEKAMAARAAEASLGPEEKARSQLQKLQQRLEKSEARLAESREKGEEEKIIEALESTIERLRKKVADAEKQLARVRLTSDLVRRPLAQKQEALSALSRLAQQFHPEEPLKRGYVIVRDSNENAVTLRDKAAQEPALVLQFADGRLNVSQGSEPSTTRPRKPTRKSTQTAPTQDDLFG